MTNLTAKVNSFAQPQPKFFAWAYLRCVQR